jgi:hypothetical protein
MLMPTLSSSSTAIAVCQLCKLGNHDALTHFVGPERAHDSIDHVFLLKPRSVFSNVLKGA